MNRDGTLIALEFSSGTTVMNATFGTVQTLLGIDGGLAFDPVRDVLYGVNSTTNQIIAYDTDHLGGEVHAAGRRGRAQSTAFGRGVMTVSGDGKYLFLSTPAGVRVYTVAPAIRSRPGPVTRAGRSRSTVTVSVRTRGGGHRPTAAR